MIVNVATETFRRDDRNAQVASKKANGAKRPKKGRMNDPAGGSMMGTSIVRKVPMKVPHKSPTKGKKVLQRFTFSGGTQPKCPVAVRDPRVDSHLANVTHANLDKQTPFSGGIMSMCNPLCSSPLSKRLRALPTANQRRAAATAEHGETNKTDPGEEMKHFHNALLLEYFSHKSHSYAAEHALKDDGSRRWTKEERLQFIIQKRNSDNFCNKCLNDGREVFFRAVMQRLKKEKKKRKIPLF